LRKFDVVPFAAFSMYCISYLLHAAWLRRCRANIPANGLVQPATLGATAW
jgi:hypothetical protein